MELNNYQERALGTATYTGQPSKERLTYTVLALCGEAGELANKLKKHLRAGTPVDNAVLMDELGDVLWYVSATAKELTYSLEEVAEFNLEKLRQRYAEKAVTG